MAERSDGWGKFSKSLQNMCAVRTIYKSYFISFSCLTIFFSRCVQCHCQLLMSGWTDNWTDERTGTNYSYGISLTLFGRNKNKELQVRIICGITSCGICMPTKIVIQIKKFQMTSGWKTLTKPHKIHNCWVLWVGFFLSPNLQPTLRKIVYMQKLHLTCVQCSRLLLPPHSTSKTVAIYFKCIDLVRYSPGLHICDVLPNCSQLLCDRNNILPYGDIMVWKCFPYFWPCVRVTIDCMWLLFTDGQ